MSNEQCIHYLQDEIKHARQEDKLHDVTLIGSDGNRVPAVRFLLATRSEVFKKMLYGEFKEGAPSEVPMSYEEEALRVIVDFSFVEIIE